MENPIKQIVKFNQQAGLLDKGYDDFLEASFQIEEALEGFSALEDLADKLKEESAKPKDLARSIVRTAIGKDNKFPSDVERLDKACDAVVFAVGSMAKLGLNAQEITKALNIVMSANIAKLFMPKDEFGKLMKPSNFIGPEEQLQDLLDKVKERRNQ